MTQIRHALLTGLLTLCGLLCCAVAKADQPLRINFEGYAVQFDQYSMVNSPYTVTATFDLGSEVQRAVAIITASDADPEALYDGLVESTIDDIQEVQNGQRYTFTVPTGGFYWIYALAFDASGEVIAEVTKVIEIDANIAGQWKYLGKGAYRENIIISDSDAPADMPLLEYEVDVEESLLHPGLYRILNPYDERFPLLDEDMVRDYTALHHIEINATDPNMVYIPRQFTGLNWGEGYGDIYVTCQIAFYMDTYGYTASQLKNLKLGGKLTDGIITFPAKEDLLCEYEDYGTVMANSHCGTRLILPEAYNPEGIASVLRPTPHASADLYDLSGRRLSAPAKGNIYIKNGKKYMGQ